jgi:hypothetical protein
MDSAGIAHAEAAAEAAAPPDRIIPLAPLALRRFRLEVLEALITAPKVKKKGKGKGKVSVVRGRVGGEQGFGEKTGLRCRLARGIDAVLEDIGMDPGERTQIMLQLEEMLHVTGVQPEQPLRRKLANLRVSMSEETLN